MEDFSRPPRKHAQRQDKKRDPYDGIRPWSAITHGFGVVFGLVGVILLLIRTVQLGADPWKLISFSIYGLSMIGLYTASTLYHSLNTTVATRIALRRYDHASIYFLIAGTYAPMCLVPLRTVGAWGWAMFGVTWGLALIGSVMTVFLSNTPRWLTAGIYLFMGWMAVIAFYPLGQTVGSAGLFWLLVGGVLYTIGGILYAVKWPGRDNPRFGCHEIFHVFIVLGSLFHFLLMYRVIVLF